MNKHFFTLSRLLVTPVLLAFLVTSFIYGCTKEKNIDAGIVARVNKEPIRLEDFQREMALRSKQDPSYKITPEAIDEQIDTIIDRRLMVQEAMKMGLTSNKEFVRTIQTFWEQTLIRELIEAKNREWEKRLFVSENEINDYYEKLRQTAKNDASDFPPLTSLYEQIKRDILTQKKTDALEGWLKEVREKAVIEVNEKLLDASCEINDKSGKGSRSGDAGEGNGG
ncbi:MAG: SurA N-terminal domain-containing protein [Nitrospirota bacterium]